MAKHITKEEIEIRELLKKGGLNFDKFRLIRIFKNTDDVLVAQFDNATYTIEKPSGKIVAIGREG